MATNVPKITEIVDILTLKVTRLLECAIKTSQHWGGNNNPTKTNTFLICTKLSHFYSLDAALIRHCFILYSHYKFKA